MAAVFLGAAAALMSLFGLPATSYAVTLVLAAGVLAGGTFAIIYFGGVILHIVRRVLNRQPIMEIEE